MFAQQLRRAVEASPRIELPKVSALLWKAYAAGQVTDDLTNRPELTNWPSGTHKGTKLEQPGSAFEAEQAVTPFLTSWCLRRRVTANTCFSSPPARAARRFVSGLFFCATNPDGLSKCTDTRF